MIKPIKLPLGFFLYDAYINRFAQVNEDTYNAICCNDINSGCDNPAIQSLLKDGFFKDNNYDFHIPNEQILKTLYQRALRGVILQVTQNCNLRCSYCPYTENAGDERLHSNKRMSEETAKKAVDFLHRNSIDSEVVVIGFYGGEPFIEFQLIKTTIEYAKRKLEGKEVLFSITTNATLLSDEILEYLNDNNVSLLISLDGPEKINDANRVFAANKEGTYRTVVEALKKILVKYTSLKEKTSINMVMDPTMDFDEYFGIFDECSVTSQFSVKSQLVDNTSLKRLFKASDDFIADMRYYGFLNELWANNRVSISSYHSLLLNEGKWNVDEKFEPFNSGPIDPASLPSGPCIPGTTKLFIDVEGRFFPCEKTSEVLDVLNIGDLEAGFNFEKCFTLTKMPFVTENECKTCFAFHGCDSCYVFSCSKKGIDREKRLKHCFLAKKKTEELLERYIIKNRHLIRSYI